ncbi:hypothetical protein NEOLEDRAFT_313093 [Neolentinus lepideus HHB14362 ss-1]|uniref:Uncharacterized protein n=1 Tax=Neolentinus lepideus HHB14362 ss-1 TaxID=1314782 RepID=A0A165VT14_9AGAM|nr:hypothetical protein NEOLEDRAFT_313093 [Neolentinus lepideus HHB14362 ss-1]
MTVTHTPKGNISKRQPSERNLKKPRAWWEAQIIFYNCKKGPSISAMQEILRAAITAGSLSVPKATLDLEATMKKEYIELSTKAAEDSWNSCTTDEERVNLDAERFLRETFDRKKTPPVDLYVIKGGPNLHRIGVHQATERMTLHMQSADALGAEGELWTRWVIVGRDRSKVYEHATWIEAEARRRSYQQMQAQLKALKKKRAKNLGRESDTEDRDEDEVRLVKRARRGSSTPASNDDDDDIDSLQDDFERQSTAQSLSAVSDEDKQSSEQQSNSKEEDDSEEERPEYKRDPKLKPIIARFPDTLNVIGTWNIYAPKIAQEWGHVSAESMCLQLALHKTKKGEQLFADFDLGIATGVFAFDTPPISPTLECTFLWRGRDTSEGEMQFGTGRNGKLTFDEDGETLKGVIAGLWGTWSFEGEKVSLSVRSGARMKEEYEEYNEDAYERERVARWH